MAKTITSIILSSLDDINSDSINERGAKWTSPGELLAYAQDKKGYNGSSSKFFRKAEDLAERGAIQAIRRGRTQANWYKCNLSYK